MHFFFWFYLPPEFSRICGLVIYSWKGLETPFQRCNIHPEIFDIAVAQEKRKHP
jgi:hypothetical protein